MTSHKIRKFLEKARLVRAGLGLQLTALVSVMSLVVSPTHAFDYSKSQAEIMDRSQIEVISTGTTYSYPVDQPIGVSQGYHGLHHGVDIRAPKGSKVVAIADGVVIEIKTESFGYGKHLMIAHNGTLSSLYAHLDTIEVTVGQKVLAGQEIGKVGTTGWTTGPHLHFELLEGNNTINPEGIFSANQ